MLYEKSSLILFISLFLFKLFKLYCSLFLPTFDLFSCRNQRQRRKKQQTSHKSYQYECWVPAHIILCDPNKFIIDEGSPQGGYHLLAQVCGASQEGINGGFNLCWSYFSEKTEDWEAEEDCGEYRNDDIAEEKEEDVINTHV